MRVNQKHRGKIRRKTNQYTRRFSAWGRTHAAARPWNLRRKNPICGASSTARMRPWAAPGGSTETPRLCGWGDPRLEHRRDRMRCEGLSWERKEQKEGEKAPSGCNYLPHLNNTFVVIFIEHSLTASMWDLTRARKEKEKRKKEKKKKKKEFGSGKVARGAGASRTPFPDGAPRRPPRQRKRTRALTAGGTLRLPPRTRPSGGGAYGLVPSRRAMALFNTDPLGRLPSASSRPVRRRGVPSRRRGVTERTGWGRGDSQHCSPFCSPLLPRRAAASGIPERVFMWQQMGAARSEQHRDARAGAAASVCVPAPHPGAHSSLAAPMCPDGAARSSSDSFRTKHSPKREPQCCVEQLQAGAESHQTS
ncbi:uncharacterized protein [Excalfactoria chinensis]|uniref:uncharacterized protein n=1 Tax=Excalfactoria chinensis TaxID=46218 RepID=UPI003B3B8178